MKMYENEKWQKLREKILNRDGYSCQNQFCNAFNPLVGTVELLVEGKFMEIHKCESPPTGSLYSISSEKYNLTITLEFLRKWLVFPILQVHHKKYIKGRNIWEYDEADLVTLCKHCHTLLHKTQEIPCFNSQEQFLTYKKFEPENIEGGYHHNHEPWVFIEKRGDKEYVLASADPQLTYLVLEHQNEDEIEKKANLLVEEFFNKYLPRYKR